MRNRRLLPASIAAASICLGALPGVSLAQGFSLEEVVVTARKREESLQDVPVAVSNFSADDLQALNMTDTRDVAAFTPSVYIEQPGGNSGTVAKVTIRGQSQSDNIIPLDPSVGWYLDDVYMARTQGTNTSMFDIDRVEILKGPQGTLYGRNTTGGTIKLVTAKADPTAGVTGFVVGGVGDYDQSKIGGAINIPVIEDVLAVRLTALKDVVDEGYQDVFLYEGNPLSPKAGQLIGQRENGTKDNQLFRVGVSWDATDDLAIQLSYEKNEAEVSMANGNTVPQPEGGLFDSLGYIPPSSDFKTVHLNIPNIAQSESETFSATLTYDINANLSTKLVYGWREVISDFYTDIDGTNTPFSQFAFPFEQEAEQDSIEWQLTGSAMDGALDWVTGVYWFEETGEDRSYSGGLSAFGAGALYELSIGTADANKSKSAFFQGTLHLTDTVNFTGGVRYTKDTKPIEVIAARSLFNGNLICRFEPDAGLPNQNNETCTWGNSDNYEFVSWTAGFDWAMTEDVMTYIKASSSSRSGGQNYRALDGDTAEPFSPETATDIELGLKGQFLDNSVQLNAAYFHTFYSDIQQSLLINVPGKGLITQVVNQAEADIDGLELEAKWIVTDFLQLTGTLGLLDWKFGDDSSILQATPTEEYTLRANYIVPTDYGQWLFDVNWSYRGEYPGNCALGRLCVEKLPQETGEAVDLWGARVGVDIDSLGLNVALWGRNLLDEDYVAPGLQLYFPPSVALSNSQIGAPRTYGLEATYRF